MLDSACFLGFRGITLLLPVSQETAKLVHLAVKVVDLGLAGGHMRRIEAVSLERQTGFFEGLAVLAEKEGKFPLASGRTVLLVSGSVWFRYES